MRNYLSFISKIKKSTKPVLRQLYQITKNDVLTTTGSNLRNILLLTNLSNVDHLNPNIVDQISYKQINDNDLWRVELIREAIDMKYGVLETPDQLTAENIDEILNFACSQ